MKLLKFFGLLLCALGIVVVSAAIYFLGLQNIVRGNQVAGARKISAHPNLSRVIDADTLDLDGIRVRLDGIAAPERGHEVYTKGKWFVEDLMQQSQSVECELEGRKSYDREVGLCYFVMKDGRRVDPQAEVVRMGLARDCPRYSNGKYEAEEAEAVRSGLNLSEVYQLPSYCQR